MSKPGKPSKALLEEGFFEFKKTCSKRLCWVRGCRNDRRHDRCLCHKHEMQRWRSKRKQTAAYCTLRDHARARRIEFSITIEYWKGLTDAYNFFENNGAEKKGDILTIDRVNPCLGYVPSNLRVVTLSVNCIKSARERYLPEHVQEMLRREREAAREEAERYLEDDEDFDNCPF